MKQLRFRLAAFFAIGLTACGGGGGDPGDSVSLVNNPPAAQAAVHELVDAYAATLNGIQEVPPRSSSANGAGTVAINAATRLMSAVLTTTGIAGTSANIHQGPPGVNGPIVFPLNESPRGSGNWIGSATLTEAQYAAFKAGEFYFNVQSLAFAGGEIRGQIRAHVPGGTSSGTASGAGGLVTTVTSNGTFLSALRGTQEVPPNASAALGSGTILLDVTSRQVTAAVAAIGMASTSAHIHEGAPGVNGSILIPLVESSVGSGIWAARATLTEDQYNTLKAGNMYFNVHSTAFPGGEIRGQILPQQISLSSITGVDGNPEANTATGTGTTGTTTGTGTGTGTGTTGAGSGPTGTGTTGTGATPPSAGTGGSDDSVGLRF